jgi:hypothetical protein
VSIFDIFNIEKRERTKSLSDYDSCHKHRKAKLQLFRLQAMQELKFEYPNSIILINRLSPKFYIYAKGDSKILQGDYADEYYPELAFVGGEASTEARNKEIKNYTLKVKNSVGNVCKIRSGVQGGISSFISGNQYKSDIRIKGFGVYLDWEVKYIYGMAIYLNGREIASSTVWDKKPSNHFAKVLSDKIIHGNSTESGFSCLELVLGYCNPGESANIRYDILFDDRVNYSNVDEGNSYRQAFNDLNAFISVFEGEIITKPVDDFYDFETHCIMKPTDREWKC